MQASASTLDIADAPAGAHVPLALIAEFPRNPSGETIRIERDAIGLIWIAVWNPGFGDVPAHYSKTFACNDSHLSPLIDGLVKAIGPGRKH